MRENVKVKARNEGMSTSNVKEKRVCEGGWIRECEGNLLDVLMRNKSGTQ